MACCLLLVDIQNDYFPGGKMELVGIEDAATQARGLLDAFRKAELPVIHVQHISAYPGSTFFVPETEGARIHRVVAPQAGERVIAKGFPNSFRDTRLLDLLRDQGTDSLCICGAMSHMCIDATTRAAFDLGFNCTVADDACATRDLRFKGRTVKAGDVHASFMAALSFPYAKVAPTKDVVAGLLEME